MRVQPLVPALPLVFVAMSGILVSQSHEAPETFRANAHVAGGTTGAGAATVVVRIERYTPEAERTAVETALKTGGYPAFVAALRKAPEVGYVAVGDRKWPIRWAREQPAGRGRTIVVVTPEPIFFVGGGRVDAKSREGYEVALIRLEVDNVGLGKGSMAAAARVKPGGEAGVVVEDYAEKPIDLVTVVRKIE
jgi:hypothetical protein